MGRLVIVLVVMGTFVALAMVRCDPEPPPAPTDPAPPKWVPRDEAIMIARDLVGRVAPDVQFPDRYDPSYDDVRLEEVSDSYRVRGFTDRGHLWVVDFTILEQPPPSQLEGQTRVRPLAVWIYGQNHKQEGYVPEAHHRLSFGPQESKWLPRRAVIEGAQSIIREQAPGTTFPPLDESSYAYLRLAQMPNSYRVTGVTDSGGRWGVDFEIVQQAPPQLEPLALIMDGELRILRDGYDPSAID